MYKLLLCWRYLRTRYIALASIISVMLGVATMIVVNSVMAGFSHEMQARLHSMLSDVVVESHGLEGFPNAQWHMGKLRELAGADIAGMTPTVHVPALLNFQVRGKWVMRQVSLIGIDEATHSSVSDFGRYLQHPKNRQRASFDLHEDGYDVVGPDAAADAPPRDQMLKAGWVRRRQQALYRQAHEPVAADAGPTGDPFRDAKRDESVFDPSKETHTGAIGGIALFSYRGSDGRDRFLVLPGDDVQLTFPTVGQPPDAISQTFTVTDFYESKMSEYDSSFMFVPLAKLQQFRGTNNGGVTAIQIRLKPGVDLDQFRDKLRAHFPPEFYGVYTWRDKQGPLLAAVQMETAILNVLLFLIIAVAGFGILAIFFMIVVEKTRDIGILKALGASGRGIMGIFLGYGLSLGIVGSGVGLGMGLLLVCYINEIADWLGKATGRPLFDPSVYYFQEIPTIVDPLTVASIVAGAMLIAVLASILPARRAARLHPVEALRYE